MSLVVERVHARVGLLGNPSDGYSGACISFSLANFWAEVCLTPSPTISFLPHPQHDSYSYENLQCLRKKIDSCGYYGGVRLLQAMVHTFIEWCEAHGINLSPEKNFTLSYDTTIPRQAGLSGSSAICCAALNCLLRHYNVHDDVCPIQQRPNIVLEAEKKLGITAGLQDRVIQVYGGLVFMDFDDGHMQRCGCGEYLPMDPDLLALDGRPGLLHVMYANNPSDSGAVHADVRQRWTRGDEDVRRCMAEVAECARKGRAALEQRDVAQLARLINRNFDLRREMFGDVVLGEQNLAMIELARSRGCAAKFTGSGGAVLVLCPDGQGQAEELEAQASKAGFTLISAVLACKSKTSALNQ